MAIGLGGALGAMARVLMSKVFPVTILLELPFQILMVNVTGCFLMGVLLELMALYWSPHPALKMFLTSGFLGGFTTFSAFALEFGLLIDKNLHGWAIFYAVMSVFLSLSCFFIGIKLIRLWLV
jgi:CrcB protein